MKTKPTYVQCSVCQAQFPVVIHSKTIHIFPRVWKLYIRCPTCKTVYTSGYFDAEVQRRIDLGASKEEIIQYQKGLAERYDPIQS